MIHEATAVHMAVASRPHVVIPATVRRLLIVCGLRWVPAATAAVAKLLRDEGYDVRTPVDVLREAGTLDRTSLAFARAATSAALDADAIIVRPSWERDPFLQAAVALAEATGLDVVQWGQAYPAEMLAVIEAAEPPPFVRTG